MKCHQRKILREVLKVRQEQIKYHPKILKTVIHIMKILTAKSFKP